MSKSKTRGWIPFSPKTEYRQYNIKYRKTVAVCATTVCNGRERGAQALDQSCGGDNDTTSEQTGAGQRKGADRGGTA
ncbi:hypothetical protein LQZ18_09690 [Lachnospiraceae bacterium ZAX-1]